jgi:hypothetical protein
MYAGVSIVILIAAAAISLSITAGSLASRHADITPKLAVARGSAAEENPSPYKSRELPVGAFDRLKVSGPFKVAVFVSDQPRRVTLLGPPALLADTIATVEAGTLVIRFREGAMWSWNPGSGVNVVVSTPGLTSASIEGAADLEIAGVRGDMFSARTDGSGSITVTQLSVRRIMLAASGAGGITAAGSAQDSVYSDGGPGSIDAKNLRVQHASIAIGGAGSVEADVSRTANISVEGSGRVDVVGGASCIKQPANSPRVECR